MLVAVAKNVILDGLGFGSKFTRNGPRGPAGLGIPFAVGRMQNLVEILGQPFAEMLIWIPKFKNVVSIIISCYEHEFGRRPHVGSENRPRPG